MKLSGVINFFVETRESIKLSLVVVVVRLVLDQSLKISCHCVERQKEPLLDHWKNEERELQYFGFICKEANASSYCPSSEYV